MKNLFSCIKHISYHFNSPIRLSTTDTLSASWQSSYIVTGLQHSAWIRYSVSVFVNSEYTKFDPHADVCCWWCRYWHNGKLSKLHVVITARRTGTLAHTNVGYWRPRSEWV